MTISRLQVRLAWCAGLFLLASALLNVVLVVRQVVISRDVEAMGTTLAGDPENIALIQAAPRVQGQMRALASDLVAYSQAQPAMVELLARHGVSFSPSLRGPSTQPERRSPSP